MCIGQGDFQANQNYWTQPYIRDLIRSEEHFIYVLIYSNRKAAKNTELLLKREYFQYYSLTFNIKKTNLKI